LKKKQLRKVRGSEKRGRGGEREAEAGVRVRERERQRERETETVTETESGTCPTIRASVQLIFVVGLGKYVLNPRLNTIIINFCFKIIKY